MEVATLIHETHFHQAKTVLTRNDRWGLLLCLGKFSARVVALSGLRLSQRAIERRGPESQDLYGVGDREFPDMHYRLLVYGLALAGLVTVFVGTQALGQQKRPEWEEARATQIEAARREGIPITPSDLQRPNLPADQNAATYVAQIRILDKTAPVSPEESKALEAINATPAPTPDQIARAKKALEAHSERVHLIHQVAQCPAYWEPPKMLDVGGIRVPDDFPRDAQFRDYARWLVYESNVLLQEGKPLDAIQVDALGFSLARQVGSQGSLITLLVSEAIDALALSGLRTILYHEADNPAAVAAIGQAIETQRSAPNFRPTLRGEVVRALSMSESERHMRPDKLVSEPGDTSNPPFEKTKEYRLWTRKYQYPTDPKLAMARFLDMNDAHYLAWMRRLFSLVDLPYPESLSGIQAIARESKKNELHPDYTLAALSIVVWPQLPAGKARHQAGAETLRTAAALLAWKIQNGHFPESLAECLKSVPLDPFDLRPLRYRREGDGFVLYSIGESGKFEGGQPNKRPRPGETFFRYPRPVYPNK